MLIEAGCYSADDCVEASAGGADRIELCSAPVLGGLTPSLGTIVEARRATRLPIVCMVRPRAGGFGYSRREFDAMLRDARLAVDAGVEGLVFGILHPSGDIDVERCAELVEVARAAGRAAVFHRAFDLVPEPFHALETLIGLGCTRILTSGQQPTALAGAPLIRELVLRAAGRIQILAGGSIRETNVADIIRITGVREIHLAPFVSHPDTSGRANPALSAGFGGSQVPEEGHVLITDAEALRRLRRAAADVTER